MLVKTLLAIMLLSFFIPKKLGAEEIMYMGRSIKGLLLGDAFTTGATDEFALYYNPALLGRSWDVRFNLLNPSFGMTNALDEIDRFTDFPSSATAITERLMGFPIYLNIGAFPYVKMGPFAFSLFANSTTSMVMRNSTHPSLRWDYRLDRGFIFGGAFSFGKGKTKSLWGPKLVRKKKKKESVAGSRLSIGFALKRIQREGLSGDFDVFGAKFLNTLNSGASSLSDFRNSLGFSKGSGWGFDAGADYIYNWANNTFTAGLSILDIGDTRFKRTQGSYDIPVQDMFINTGVSFGQNFGLFDYNFSLDLHPLNEPIDTLRKLHLGLELSLPIFKLYTGWNAGYLSYGTEFDLWIFNVMAGFYGVEVGANYKQEEAQRFVIYTSLLNFGFSP